MSDDQCGNNLCVDGECTHDVGQMLTAKVNDNAMKAQGDALNQACVSMTRIARACGSAPQDNVSISVR